VRRLASRRRNQYGDLRAPAGRINLTAPSACLCFLPAILQTGSDSSHNCKHIATAAGSQPVTASLPVIRFSPVCCHSTNAPQSSAVRDRSDRPERWHFGSSLNEEVWFGPLICKQKISKSCLLTSPFWSNCNDSSMAERNTVCPIVTTAVRPNVLLFVQL
jgi:hypothetical protein